MQETVNMSSCCNTTSDDNQTPKHLNCPDCDKKSNKISISTILQHLVNPWKLSLEGDTFYVCETADCNTFYFNSNNRYSKDDIREKIAIKSPDEDAMLCHCFDITRNDFENNPSTKQFVIEQTKEGVCTCTTRNPAGRCCLKDFR